MILQDLGLNDAALDRIALEDKMQIEKWGNQLHHIYEWYLILAEEVGELSKTILEKSPQEISNEATQVATLALKISWMVDHPVSLQANKEKNPFITDE